MSATPEQKIVRAAFKDSCDCFNLQPDAGGAVPPEIGPRNKSWWFADGAAWPMRYYNWFMHNTIPVFLDDNTPPWCRILITGDAPVVSVNPNTNYSGSERLWVISFGGGASPYRSFIHTPRKEGGKKLFLYCLTASKTTSDWLPIGVYAVDPDSWTEGAITWNNKPNLGALLDSVIVNTTGWWEFYIGGAKSVGIKIVDETEVDGGKNLHIHFASSEALDPINKPWEW